MESTEPSKKKVEIRWKDYVYTPKRHWVYLALGGSVAFGYLGFRIWESWQNPTDLTQQVYDLGIYVIIALLLILRGFRVHFLRNRWFIQMDQAFIKYRMVLFSRVQKLAWSDVTKIKIAFEGISFYLKNGKTHRVPLENVPDEEKVEETKKAIICFGKEHNIPVAT